MSLNDAFNGILKQCFAAIPKEQEGDYYEDGLLMCGKCHTKKQRRQIFADAPEKSFVHPIMCKCKAEELDKEKAEFNERQRKAHIYELRRDCFDDEKYTYATFESNEMRNEDDKKTTKALEKYARNFEKEVLPKNMGLILWSETVGNGKSFYAAAIANELLKREIPVKMTNFINITNENRKRYSDGTAIDELMKYPLLIIDDLGAELKTDAVKTIAYDVINGRYSEKLPTILTTNLSADTIKYPTNTQDARLYNRLLEMCHLVEVKGGSRRSEKYRKRHDKVNDWLGL